jgi:elongation factor P
MAEIHVRDLKTGATVRIDGKICRILSTITTGTGKLTHKTHVVLLTVPEGKQIERAYHPEDKLVRVDLDRRHLAFSYKEGDDMIFVDNKTYEEFRIGRAAITSLEPFLNEEAEVETEFLDGSLLNVVVPESFIVKVASCPAGLPGIDATTPKSAILENGLEVLVPQFIKPGDRVRVEVASRKYMERIQE